MTVRVVELASVAPQRWRNGGGVTRELLAWPAGSGADWQLRVSVADIERDGPFSAYPGVQRCFAVLDGAGVSLRFGAVAHVLDNDSPPLAFDGADAPDCRLIDGPTRDLNLMVRAGAGRACLCAVGDALEAAGPARWRGLYTAVRLQLVVGTESPLPLRPHSLAWSDAPIGSWRLLPAAGEPPRAWWLAST
ncbi:HutD family protein [Ideonella sp.]|uniref:HutD/Ves family protein n=1 Tax=Ideonella sp. TaxID=1929293 RepID=UPI002B47A6B2|nr:HutD family protein [Ideonella sp.]HJV68699.1 HutD family protein [Ideonella sp.]